ncbi:MAG: hypothetical protein KME32_26860 [Mojavia pulchra JT2-VF2]|jgi:hypothetical protein|uniref:Uncharacterized protein n=1 Tax=Mojavia pulchra JT2-VF2 TaxID=287848 RepID=A0A951UIZ6_9NOST|nr:hypothetical protein [Mojavia pulchra JT2-VF2]
MEGSGSLLGSHPNQETSREFYSITYALPGQVGFCVPRISIDRKYSQRLLALLQEERGIITHQVNRNAGSLLITYQPGEMSDVEMRSHLANLIESASNAAVIKPQPVTVQTTEQHPTKVAYSIAHAIPGRVRFRVPQIASDPKYVQRLESLLQEDPAVTSERVNRDAASIVITYKTGILKDSHKRMQSVLQAALSHLESLIQSASDRVARPTAQPHSLRLPQNKALRKPVLEEQAWQYTGDRTITNKHATSRI